MGSFLHRFNFVVTYHPGGKNLKADILSCLHAPEPEHSSPETTAHQKLSSSKFSVILAYPKI